MTDLELRILTATVVLEAGGEGAKGMAGVAWVIRNRMARRPWPSGVAAVCLQPLQFSAWNGDHRRRAWALTDNSDTFRRAQRICIDVFSGATPEPTNGSDHYHTLSISPSWASRLEKTATIRNHVFYK